MTENNEFEDVQSALQSVISIFMQFNKKQRVKLLQLTSTFFDLDQLSTPSPHRLSAPVSHHTIKTPSGHLGKTTPSFTKDRSMSPKEFIMDKQPKSDVERVACLAYYSAHYRDAPFFKTVDISKLNTEAAQRKFANPAQATKNALNYGYLAPATKGQRQLSAAGEKFVEALPDHNAAREAMKHARPRRKNKNSSTVKKNKSNNVA